MKKKVISGILMVMMLFVAIVTSTISSSAENVTAVRLNKSVRDSGTEREAIIYKISVPSAGRLNVNFKHANLYDTKTYWTIEVLANDLETVLQTVKSTGVDTNLTAYTLGVDKGTYYIKVWARKDCDDNYNDGMYTLTPKFKKSSVWEIEYNQKTKKTNDSQAAARGIAPNKRAYGVIAGENDVDFYKVRVTKKGYVTLNFRHKNILESDEMWEVSLVNAKTDVITSYRSKGTRTGMVSPKIGVTPGTYYIKVSGYNYKYSDVDYSVMLAFKAANGWETEYNNRTGKFNNQLTTANTIKLRKSVMGTLASEEDVDCYKIRIGATRRTAFIFNHKYIANRKIYYTVQVFNSNLQNLTTIRSYGVNSTIRSTLRLRKGTYYIKVFKGDVYRNGDYKLTVK